VGAATRSARNRKCGAAVNDVVARHGKSGQEIPSLISNTTTLDDLQAVDALYSHSTSLSASLRPTKKRSGHLRAKQGPTPALTSSVNPSYPNCGTLVISLTDCPDFMQDSVALALNQLSSKPRSCQDFEFHARFVYTTLEISRNARP
jgi:hypothetical protein